MAAKNLFFLIGLEREFCKLVRFPKAQLFRRCFKNSKQPICKLFCAVFGAAVVDVCTRIPNQPLLHECVVKQNGVITKDVFFSTQQYIQLQPKICKSVPIPIHNAAQRFSRNRLGRPKHTADGRAPTACVIINIGEKPAEPACKNAAQPFRIIFTGIQSLFAQQQFRQHLCIQKNTFTAYCHFFNRFGPVRIFAEWLF